MSLSAKGAGENGDDDDTTERRSPNDDGMFVGTPSLTIPLKFRL